MSDVKFDLSTVFSTVAKAVPDQTFLVWRDRRLSYAEFDARVDGFAHYLVSAGLGTHTEFWHLPRANLSIAISWNDDELSDRAPFLATLLRAALGTR